MRLLDVFLQVIDAGANALVAGSAVFGAPDYAEGESNPVIFAASSPRQPRRLMPYPHCCTSIMFVLMVRVYCALLTTV